MVTSYEPGVQVTLQQGPGMQALLEEMEHNI